jgi:beta-1,3-galactosyltransferase 1
MKHKLLIASLATLSLFLLLFTNRGSPLLRLAFPGSMNEPNVFEINATRRSAVAQKNTPNTSDDYNDHKVLLSEQIEYKDNKQAQYFLKTNFWHPAKVRIILKPWNTCTNKTGSNLDAFAYVLTRVSTFELRTQIRETWANRSLYPNLNVAFVLGLSQKQIENSQVKLENAQYGDIIQGDFVDSYRNLSFKSLISWRWIKYNCMGSKYFLKIDDDVYMNTPKLLGHISSPSSFDSSQKPYSFSCIIWNSSVAVRDRTNKMYTTFEEWPNATYPTYCRGIAYLMTNPLPAKLYDLAHVTRDLWIDDAMTGIVASNINGLAFNDWSRIFYLDGYNFEKNRAELQSYFFFEPFHLKNRSAFMKMSTYLGIG